MKIRSNSTKLWTIAVLVTAAIMSIVVTHRSSKSQKQPDVLSRSELHSPSLEPQTTQVYITNTIPPPSGPEAVSTTSMTIVDALLRGEHGRVTTSEAHEMLKNLVGMPDFQTAIDNLLRSSAVSDRLLAVKALVEAGETNALHDIALSDGSMYVRAEVIQNLFKRRHFPLLADIISSTSSKITGDDATALLAAAVDDPIFAAPPVLSRLDVGQGLPRYVVLLTGESHILQQKASDILAATNIGMKGKTLLLNALADCRPTNYTTVLWGALLSETSPPIQRQIARYLAGTISEADPLAWKRLDSSLLAIPKGMPTLSLASYEKAHNHLLELASEVRSLCSSPTRSIGALNIAFQQYLDTARLLGHNIMAADLLRLVAEYADEDEFLRNEAKSTAAYEYWRMTHENRESSPFR